jgi:hypothetical protein
VSDAESCNICKWLRDLPDENLHGVFGCLRLEFNRRWPGSFHTPTPEEIADPKRMAEIFAISEAALAKHTGKIQ